MKAENCSVLKDCGVEALLIKLGYIAFHLLLPQ
jgi:hypothetical protein